jgi:YVTN family beta-propeller protein
VWVANTITGSLSEVSSATDEVVKSFVAGSEPTGLAVGYGSLWVADAPASAVAAVNTATDQVTNYPLTSPPFGIAVGAGSVWLSSPRDDNVTRFSTQGGPPVEVPVGAGPTAVAFGLGSVWVTNGLDNTVSRINPGTNSVEATIPVGEAPDALAIAGGSVWVANRLSSTLTRVDPSTDSAVRSVPIGGGPIALTALGQGIWTATGTPATGALSGGTLRVVSSVPTPSVDPALATYEPFQFFEGTYDTLVTFQRVGGSEGLQLVPDLALTMPTVTAGRTTYSFVLRAGLRYSDGQPVRPEDFRHGIERAIELNPNAATFLSGIVGAASCLSGRPCDLSAGIVVSARADAITFHLTAPDPNFLYQLALQFTAPVPSNVADHDVGVHPVPSTGPYMISHYVPGHEVVFVRNPYFREWSAAAEPAGSPDRIVWTFGQSIPKEIAEIAAGTADWSNDFIPDLGALTAQFPAQVHVNPALSIDYVAFNIRVAPFNDVRVRQAFSLAANRDELVDMLGGPDAASPACQILPPGIPGYRQYCPFTVDPSPGGSWVGPNLAAARKLVAESGTRGMRVVFWSPPGAGPTSAFAVSVLRQLGYRTSMVTPSFNTYFENVNDSRRNVQVTDGSWYVDYPSASDFFDQFFRCSAWKLADPSAVRNGSFFCEPGLDHLMDMADHEELTDPTQAAATWAEVDRGVTNAAPWVVLANLTEVDFLSSRITNYQYNPALIGCLLDQLEIRQR